MLQEIPQDYYFYFFTSALLWAILLILPPGMKDHISHYRLHFVFGVICSVMSFLSIVEILPSKITTMATLSYFVVDTIGNLINDFIQKVESYQSGTNRIIEYIHHSLCIIVIIFSEIYYKSLTNLDVNLVVHFFVAELSTPPLMLWRHYKYDWLGALFALTFFAVRIVYQSFIFVPFLVKQCNSTFVTALSPVYVGINFYFFYGIIKKIMTPKKEKKEKKDH